MFEQVASWHEGLAEFAANLDAAVLDGWDAKRLVQHAIRMEKLDDAAKLEWHKDGGTRQLIQAVLTSGELAEFDAAQFGKITWLQRRFDSKILLASRKLISGEEFGADGLEQARLIQQKAVSLQSETA